MAYEPKSYHFLLFIKKCSFQLEGSSRNKTEDQNNQNKASMSKLQIVFWWETCTWMIFDKTE